MEAAAGAASADPIPGSLVASKLAPELLLRRHDKLRPRLRCPVLERGEHAPAPSSCLCWSCGLPPSLLPRAELASFTSLSCELMLLQLVLLRLHDRLRPRLLRGEASLPCSHSPRVPPLGEPSPSWGPLPPQLMALSHRCFRPPLPLTPTLPPLLPPPRSPLLPWAPGVIIMAANCSPLTTLADPITGVDRPAGVGAVSDGCASGCASKLHRKSEVRGKRTASSNLGGGGEYEGSVQVTTVVLGVPLLKFGVPGSAVRATPTMEK